MLGCTKLDTCYKIKTLTDQEWACDSQLLDAVCKTYEKCGEEL